MVSSYLEYMRKVLGVSEVLLCFPAESPEANSAVISPSIEVLFIDDKKWSTAASDLFQKMRDAMKLSPDQIEVLFAESSALSDIQIKSLQAHQIVSFSQDIYNALKTEFADQIIQTVGPEILLKDSSQKKQTWGDLQQVMKRLKT